MALKALLWVCAALALFAAVTLWRARAHEARVERHWPPSGRILEVGGHPVHVWEAGEGPPVVLIHGASANLRDFTFSLAQRLARSYRVIALDRPGLGYTPRLGDGGASIAEQAGLLSEAAAQLGAERPILLGHSYGGAVALAWAVHHPERVAALVPLAAASNPWDSPLSLYYKLTSHPWLGPVAVTLITAWVPDRVVENAVAEVFAPQQVPQGYGAHFAPGLTLRRATLRENALQRASINAEIRALHSRYGEIAVPTEILHGDADTTVGLSIHSEPLAGQIPGARLTVLEGIGHMPHHAREGAVAAAVDRAAARAGLR
ncbi:alpha/beta hydrolase [Rhodosalinus halophilus]|uniref:Alpha/beta hydrolase n=1 Tax=Rhodosalinus halophilus TaxID=2259333 RepID=A0A365U8A7_9RHOB|nr:alpha/beta hydrolase [Rhodosalinus halophilus]RBI85056.1 alpha/beta hydrolase [Rhodosalinus halophilus]